MKKLYLFRHGAKNPDGTLSEKGLAQARATAQLDGPKRASYVFHGPISRTQDAAVAFSRELAQGPLVVGPIHGIGSEEMVAEIVTPAFRDKVNGGASNLDALFAVHPSWLSKQWSVEVAGAIIQMFRRLGEDWVGVAFGHDPLWSLGIMQVDDPELGSAVASLPEGGGFEVVRHNDGSIEVIGPVHPPQIPAGSNY